MFHHRLTAAAAAAAPVTSLAFPGGHIAALDGIRGIAVLLVMFGHFSTDARIHAITGYGDAGVVIFFCLIGFLITNVLLNLRDAPITVWAKLVLFYKRRSLRIFPAYYAFIVGALLYGYPPVANNLFRLLTYTANYFPCWPLHSTLGYVSHLWSLSIEEQFYWFWPLLVVLINQNWLKRTVAGLVIIMIIYKLILVVIGNTTRLFEHDRIYLYAFIFRTSISWLDGDLCETACCHP
jgi:peptidoglycan/LPS O-acetylase OafA/YrhL